MFIGLWWMQFGVLGYRERRRIEKRERERERERERPRIGKKREPGKRKQIYRGGACGL